MYMYFSYTGLYLMPATDGDITFAISLSYFYTNKDWIWLYNSHLVLVYDPLNIKGLSE